MTKTPLLMVAGALLLSPVPALAGDLPTRTVRYGDLDLTQPEGVIRLERRVAAAVRSVCRAEDPRDLSLAVKVNKCRKIARHSASDQTQLAIASARSAQRLAAKQGASPVLQ
jgi:UrcA family protein